jgi:hypothetical protein
MTETGARAKPATSGFIALLLLTGGGFALAGQVMPVIGAATLAALGIELVIWAFLTCTAGLLVAGSVLAGVGTGVTLVAGPLVGAQPQTIGAAFLFSGAAGLAMLAILSWLWWRQLRAGAMITAVVVGAAGAAALVEATSRATALNWGVPAALLIGGLVAVTRWLRGRQP